MATSNACFELEDIVLDGDSRRFYVGDREIYLSNKEFSLLEYLLENMGRVVSRTDILESVWDRNICCNTNTVDVHVSNLRKKIRPYVAKELIHTVHCIGYMLEP